MSPPLCPCEHLISITFGILFSLTYKIFVTNEPYHLRIYRAITRTIGINKEVHEYKMSFAPVTVINEDGIK